MVPDRSQLPSRITSLSRWGGWKYIERDGKKIKLPVVAATGKANKSNDETGWIGFDQARALVVARRHVGLAFLFRKDGIVGIDMDRCRVENGVIKPWAFNILKQFPTYAEVSPSGTGIKLFVGGALAGDGIKRFVDANGKTVKTQAESDGAIEMYDRSRFFTVTGQTINADLTEITDHQDAVESLERYLRGSNVVTAPVPRQTGGVLAKGDRHPSILSYIGKLRQADMPAASIHPAAMEFNQTYCTPPKSEAEVHAMVEWILQKPPGSRLSKWDYAQFREKPSYVNGAAAPAEPSVFSRTKREPPPAPAPFPEPIPIDRASREQHAAALRQHVIDAKDAARVYDDDFIKAVVAAGDIFTQETRRLLKDAFSRDFSVKEFDMRQAKFKEELRHLETPYILTSDGGIKPCLANAITMMSNLPIRYNAFTLRPFLEKESPWHTIRNWTDYDDLKCAEWCQQQMLNIDKITAADACEAIARARPHYHPVVEYLTGLKWDGEERIDTWLSDYLGVKDTPYSRQVGRKWLIQAVKRVLEPGCQADYTIVFEGLQGKKKSTALRILAVRDEWFTDDITDIGSKDAAIQLVGKWIVELSELDAMRRAREVTTVKAWLTRRIDHYRPPYGRRAEDFPRHCVFAATTNKEDWLADDTGGRRFWPVKATKADIEGLLSVRDQLCAEAMFYYGENEPSYLSEEMEAVASEEQEARQEADDDWTDLIREWILNPRALDPPLDETPAFHSTKDKIFSTEILWHCIGKPKKDWKQEDTRRVNRILRRAKYRQDRLTPTEREAAGLDKRLLYWKPPVKPK
jgi:hypothetical protein